MTGPEHYTEAESLLTLADDLARDGGDTGEIIAAAHVHATLALAAATALSHTAPGVVREWNRVAN